MSFIASIQADIGNFESNLDKAQARLDEFASTVGKSISEIGQDFIKIGGVMSLGITTPFAAMSKAAFDLSADFEDALGASDQIFTDSADSVKDWANDLKTYFGITKKEALEYSNLMGSMLINIGNLTEDQAAKQGSKLIELAGDLTAMYGGQTQDAVRALTGALKGNNTMLDNYGMAVNDSIVKTRALELGLVKQGKEMSLSAKQAATLSLIYEQSAAAQGQAAREAEGASGSMRALRTEITNLATEFGDILLPVITPLINSFKNIVAGFRELSPEVKKNIVIIGGLTAALGPLLLGLGTLMQLAPFVGSAFTLMTGPVGIAIAAIAAGAVLIVKNWDTIRDYFSSGNGAKIWDNIKSGAVKIWNTLSTIFNTIKNSILAIWDKIGTNVISIFKNSFGIVLSIVEGVIGVITGVIKTFAAILNGDFKGALLGVKEIFTSVFDTIKSTAVSSLATISQAVAGFLKLVGAEGLGSSLEKWGNSLLPIKEDNKGLALSVDDVSTAVTKKAKNLKDLQPELEKTKKDTRDYKNELINLFSDWGYYNFQVEALTKKFEDYNKIAKKAGASTAQLATIAREQLGEKLALALNQFNLKEIKPKVVIDTEVKIDTDKIGEELSIANAIVTEKAAVLKSTIEGIVVDLGAALSEMTASAFQALGSALVNGDSVLKSIGSALLSTLGGIMIELGQMAIAAGIGIESVKKALLTLQGPIAIAAGVALVTIGSVFKSGASKLGNSMGSGSVGSGASYSSITRSPDYSQFRGALYNNEKQVVELKLKNTELTGAIKLNNNRNNRLG